MAKTQARSPVRLVVIIDAAGRIVAAAPAYPELQHTRETAAVKAALKPLPDQTAHVVDMPNELKEWKSAREVAAVLSRYRLAPQQSQLVLA